MKPWVKRGCVGCAGVGALGLLGVVVLGGIFVVQRLALEPEEEQLAQPVHLAATETGRIVLSLSSAAVTVKAGPAGGPIRVESNFDPAVHRLEQSYDDDAAGGWNYRLDFHEKRTLHISVISIWFGARSPELLVEIPRDLPITLEIEMEGGYLDVDLAGLDVATAKVDLFRGVLGLNVSEPLRAPMEWIDVSGSTGTMSLRSLGNASPGELRMHHGVGAALVDLSGAWGRDSAVDFQVTLGSGELRLPDGVHIEGATGDSLRVLDPADREIPVPTLRVSTHADFGEVRVVD